MIDHDAAVELWDRYKRGERNVFTRRLYTLQGQQTFDEIRRRYRRDEEFKETVDRYIDEFERLLDDASQGGRDQGVANSYLTSETGKVYTMLAHASGRFE
jgi:phosphoglycolate phosphatase-like HAD superfamily hydrolase